MNIRGKEEEMFIRNANLRKGLGMGRLLQADGGAGTGGTGGSTGDNGGAGTEGSGEGDKGQGEGDKSFDDVLKDKKYQSEFDKRVAKALETAKGKWETDYQAKVEEAKTEAEKLAKMNAEQKAKYAEQKRIQELENREKAITARELRATTLETLAEKKLPNEFADIINYSSADSCKESIEAIEKAWTKAQGSWQKAVEAEANKRLRGGNPPKGGQGNNGQSVFGFNFTGVRPKK